MNNLYLLWYSKRFRVISGSLIISIIGCVFAYLFLSYMGFFEKTEGPKAFVPVVTNLHGLEMPSVQVKSLNPKLQNLDSALQNDADGMLIRYVNGYIHAATSIVVNQDIVTNDQKIEFINDSDMNAGVRSLPWNSGFAVGLSYHGGAVSDPMLLDKMAYGILVTWTGERDPLKASTKLLGDKFPEAIRFPMAISHIHQEMLSNIYLIDLEKSSLVDFKSLLLAVKDLPVDQDQLRKLNHAITHNVAYLTNYLSETSKVADEQLTNKKAYYLLNYYLATDYTLYSMITRKMENTIASNSYKEKIREMRMKQEEESRIKMEKDRARDERRARAIGGDQLSGPGQETKSEVQRMIEQYKSE
ncbi:hypothetical protein ACI2KR_07225 [Pseudomonas luteola]